MDCSHHCGIHTAAVAGRALLARMIDPTHDEIDFIRRIMARGGGEISLQGSIKLLKIDRLPRIRHLRQRQHGHWCVHTHTKGLGTSSIDRTQISAARWRAFLTLIDHGGALGGLLQPAPRVREPCKGQ